MKKVLFLIVAVLIGYFFYTRVGESSSPSYGTYKLTMPSRSGQIGLTIIEKLRPGLECRGFNARKAAFVSDFLEGCPACKLTDANCKDNLNATEQKIFDNRVIDRPYFSYEKGGLMSQQDFRILFSALTEAESKGVCLEIRKYLKNDLLFFVGGRTECVRKSEAIG